MLRPPGAETRMSLALEDSPSSEGWSRCRQWGGPCSTQSPQVPQFTCVLQPASRAFLFPPASHLHGGPEQSTRQVGKSWRKKARALAAMSAASRGLLAFHGSSEPRKTFHCWSLSCKYTRCMDQPWGHAGEQSEASLRRGCDWAILGGGGWRG